jgi:alpha-tubulin suppressor-like RCC1 family protein
MSNFSCEGARPLERADAPEDPSWDDGKVPTERPGSKRKRTALHQPGPGSIVTEATVGRRLRIHVFLSPCQLLTILGSLGRRGGGRAAVVNRSFRGTVAEARELKMYGGKVLSASAGGSFYGDASVTVICTEKGVFTCGGGEDEEDVDGTVYDDVEDGTRARLALGHGDDQDEIVPRCVEALQGKSAVAVSTSGYRTMACTAAGELYSFGPGGHLGHGSIDDDNEEEEDEPVPRLVEALKGKVVTGVSTGANHTVVWTEGGEVYTFGYGDRPRLGHGHVPAGTPGEEFVPRLVEALTGKKVVGAATGADHTVVCVEGGEVYTWGWGEWGQLGHGGQHGEVVPRVVEALSGKKVMGTSAGASHTVVWTEGGEVFTFGLGGDGQLGHGGQGDELVPRLVESLAGEKVTGASAGATHTVVWTEGGGVYTFGRGNHGQLGHGEEECVCMPRVLKALEWRKVVGAAAGGVHTVVWTEAGEVYTFGNGRHGNLGLGGTGNEMVPRLVACELW